MNNNITLSKNAHIAINYFYSPKYFLIKINAPPLLSNANIAI
jgi:hypothetical protein